MFLILMILISLQSTFADTDVDLPPIIKSGTPGEVLLDDPILPALNGMTQYNSGTGTVQNSLQNQLPLSVTDYGRPGSAGQLRGLGFSSEELDVQAFGISLNPPQGGGFDLSAFPQFLWGGYRFQAGPALNGLNPTATSGVLSLVPWTSQALTQAGFGARAMQFYSTTGVNQVSVSAQGDQNLAVVAGYSGQKVRGPSFGLSSGWGKTGDRKGSEFYSGQFHLLATDLDAEAPGPTYAYSPLARMRTIRVIPILQSDFRITSSSLLKNSLFYDSSWLSYEDPATFSSRSRIKQGGLSQVYLVGAWKFGSNLKWVNYQDDFQSPPAQIFGNFQISKEMEWGSLLVQPNLQGVWVSGFGFLPQGGLGIRKEWDHQRKALFTRWTLSHRIPSLLDWYSQDRYFQGNRNLKEERDWTGIFGGELKSERYSGSLQLYSQLRQNARVPFNATVSNLGNAFITALITQYQFKVSDQIDLFGGETLTSSRLILAGQPFPFMPTLIHLTGVSVHSRDLARGWNWTTNLRAFSSQLNDLSTNSRLPFYSMLDTSIQKRVWKEVYLTGRVENVLDRSIELIPGYPLGRSLSFMLSGAL